ncbi:zinc ABC transporter substrate-binding protein [Brevibacillus sp. SYP-B805]|uniref:metal ABC transporter substrate-binding protein n=1 Tax=Brevibacillus sp. SYP-B805 TaxID=1578199 RepID=UPI0013EA5182|nr:metal ABC transporter substrate-binding protein [Brevibacillus sp. SYP-B805]NGQ95422.1 zinc ABC transporter substrate-binding protein [Brevibacillus sp. SYP-B805]
MPQSFKKALGIALLTSMVLAGCGSTSSQGENSQSGDSPQKISVVATFYPMYDFAKNVAGEHADVTALVPAGVEPHDWEPTPKDIQRIADAQVFVYNGGVEGWVEDALKSVQNKNLVVVEASKGIELMEGVEEEEEEHQEGEDHSHLDPHVWLDPVLAQKEVEAIAHALEQADPAHKDDYRKNANAYIAQLQSLDKEFSAALSSAKRKDFVTQHAAFGYLAKRYGLTQIPISGLSPEEEPSPSKLVDIVKFVKEHQVKTIFFETLAAPKVAETVAKETGAKTAVLNPIEGLTDEEKAKNLDYIGVMKNNLEALKTALNE